MKILSSPKALSLEAPDIALAAGFFDGVHIGHQKILQKTLEYAHEHGAQAWALTFEPHPLAVIAPEHKPPLLTRMETRLELLAESGIDGCLLMPFTKELALLSAHDFVKTVFGGWMQPERSCTVVSGDNWRFGHNRGGALADLTTFSNGAIQVLNSPMVVHDGARVSSSRIRMAILSGDLKNAAAMLGRPHTIRDTTTAGRGAGAKMGMATANVIPVDDVLPPIGIYEVAVSLRSHVDREWRKGVASLGFRPTFPEARPEKPELEVHILDFSGDLHGCELDVRFLRRLRDEIKFDTVEALVEQMKRDVESVRRD